MNRHGFIKGLRDVDRRLSRRLNGRRKILIDAKTPMNFAVVAPVFKELRKDPRIDFYLTSSEQIDHPDKVFDDAVGAARIITIRRAALLRFDAYLAADLVWAELPRGSRRVFMFHGVAGKYADQYDRPKFSMRHWDRIFFINRRRLNNFIASGAIDHNDEAARLVGYPKLDCLVDGTLSKDDVVSALGMNATEPVILYAPTWSPYSSLNSVGEELVRQLCDAGYKVIVKLHDRSWHPAYQNSGGVDWAARLEPVLDDAGGLLARGGDATPYLAAADIMITDHSSTGFEYLLVNRPLIRIEVPELISATRIPEEYVSLLAEAALSVSTVKAVVNAVELCLADPSARSESRRAVSRELFFDPGGATFRAVNELYEVLEIEPAGSGDSPAAPNGNPND